MNEWIVFCKICVIWRNSMLLVDICAKAKVWQAHRGPQERGGERPNVDYFADALASRLCWCRHERQSSLLGRHTHQVVASRPLGGQTEGLWPARSGVAMAILRQCTGPHGILDQQHASLRSPLPVLPIQRDTKKEINSILFGSFRKYSYLCNW